MKTITTQSVLYKNILFIGTIGAVLAVSFVAVQYAHASVNAQLDFGSTGANVLELQTYLAADSSIYPSGLVTGYFGPLTRAAVEQFQTQQNIVSNGTPATTGYGRVGPTTMARINVLIASIGGGSSVTANAPSLSGTSVNTSSNAATLIFTTSEATRGQVFYDTAPIRSDEATGPRQLPFVSGTLVSNGTSLQTTHAIALSNLQPNTVYYFLTRAIDASGNMSMTLPVSFRTSF